MKALIFFTLCLFSYATVAEDLGKSIYKSACSNCHSPKLAASIQAPPAFDKKEWRKRYKNAKIAHKNDPERYASPEAFLVYQVKKGKGLMHHGGLCNESHSKDISCSDEDLIAAIRYMSNKQN